MEEGHQPSHQKVSGGGEYEYSLLSIKHSPSLSSNGFMENGTFAKDGEDRAGAQRRCQFGILIFVIHIRMPVLIIGSVQPSETYGLCPYEATSSRRT